VEDIWQIILVWLLSTVKFVFGAVPLALGFGFSFFKTVVVTSTGGFVGVVVFVNLSAWTIKKVKNVAEKRAVKKAPKKIFTRRNKIIVQVKRKFGLPGIALLTPLLLSIPLGCFLAVRYFEDKQRVTVYMFSSILFWSVAIASYKLFIH